MTCTTYWCRPSCTLTWFVHVVIVSSFDVVCALKGSVSSVHRCAAPTGAAICACLTLVVSVVTLSVYDVLVHVTHLAVVRIVVHHLLVPPFVRSDACSTCCQHWWL